MWLETRLRDDMRKERRSVRTVNLEIRDLVIAEPRIPLDDEIESLRESGSSQDVAIGVEGTRARGKPQRASHRAFTNLQPNHPPLSEVVGGVAGSRGGSSPPIEFREFSFRAAGYDAGVWNVIHGVLASSLG